MKKRAEDPAGTPSSTDRLREVYGRQFRELTALRRHIFSLLPLNTISTIFEPGCGSGLLGRELRNLTNARYTGMDIDRNILPVEDGFVHGDTLRYPPPADLYVTSFFFSSINRPTPWLRKVRRALPSGGLFALFGDYDYQRIGEHPDVGLAKSIRESLEKEGLSTTHGGMLDGFFRNAGFTKLHGGDVRSEPAPPDGEFLEMHLDRLPETLPTMTWRIVWGIWRTGT